MLPTDENLLSCQVSFFDVMQAHFLGSDLLRNSSTANGASSDLEPFCIPESGLSSKHGSMRWDEISKDS